MSKRKEALCPCGNRIDYKPGDEYHDLDPNVTGGMCKDCLEEEYQMEFKRSNDSATHSTFEIAWELMKSDDKGDNAPTNPSLWAQAKSKARSKFKVYPSAYANGWAAKWYKSKGGGWKKKGKKGKKSKK